MGPAFEGMIVALVAVEAHAEERLADILGHLAGLTQHAQVIHCGVFIGAAFGREERARQLVVGDILRDLPADPIAVKPDGFLAKVLAVALQQVCPFVRPELHVVVAGQKVLDQLLPLLLQPVP